MSISAAAWILVFAALTLLSLKRPVYALSLYMFTFFLSPTFWWWGDAIPEARWNLYAGFYLLAIAIGHRLREGAPILPEGAWLKGIAVAIFANATFVHLFLAADPVLSSEPYWLLAKFVLLFFLMLTVVRTEEDMNTLLLTLTLGAMYVGYEVTINERGNVTGSRLEGVGVAGVQNSNELAALLLVVLPLTGSLLFTGSKYQRILVVIAAPLILNTILLCNSRGAFLAMIGMAVAILIAAPGRARRHVAWGLALGSVALFLLLGDEEILERFLTVFADESERDNSAASRLGLWRAALVMIPEHPLGAGGDGFTANVEYYLQRVGVVTTNTSIHNGFLTEATSWGLQGLVLRGLFAAGACLVTWRVIRRHRFVPDGKVSMLGACLMAAWLGWLMTSIFGDYIDNEWGYWIVAMMLSYAAMYHEAPAVAVEEDALGPEPPAAVVAPPRAASARVGMQREA